MLLRVPCLCEYPVVFILCVVGKVDGLATLVGSRYLECFYTEFDKLIFFTSF